MTTKAAICLLAIVTLLLQVGCSPREEALSDGKQHYLAAKEAIQAGDTTKAMEELGLAIEFEPDVWTYYQRAQLLEEQGETEQAIADCEAGLKLDAEHEQLNWYLLELKKPKNERFRGRRRDEPSDK